MPDSPDSPDSPVVVCFDLGGVVVRICRGFAEAAVRAGVPLRETPPLEKLAHRELVDAHQRGEIDCHAYFRSIAEERGGVYTPDEIERVHRAWIIEDYAGAAALIAKLNADPNITTACLSNTNTTHWRIMLGSGGSAPPNAWRSEAVRLIEMPLASQELGLIKPDEAIYAAAASTLGDSAGIYFFDDLAENVEAAQRAGWNAFLINPAGDPPSQIVAHLSKAGLIDAHMFAGLSAESITAP